MIDRESLHKAFIEKARQKFGDKYDYSQVEYINNKTPVTIICPKHGAFKKAPGDFLRDHACPQCSHEAKTNYDKKQGQSRFIQNAKNLFGDNYDYSKVEYINNKTPVIIICPKHGEFKQRPSNHLHGRGCPFCAKELRKKTTKKFIADAKKVHGEKYDYSKVDYQGAYVPITIICPKHGAFTQKPNSHLSGNGCPKCVNTYPLTTSTFIQKAQEVHKHKYDYSLATYNGSHEKVQIVCPKHGTFEQFAYVHLQGRGCPKCADEKTSKRQTYTSQKFIQLANEKHHNKYDYSKVEYIDSQTPIQIICPIHGVFEQKPNQHLQGHGCPYCNQSRLESEIDYWLSEHHIKHITQCKRQIFPWLKRQSLDFYLPQYKIAIECQGRQHYEPISYNWGKDKNAAQKRFEEIQERDARKARLCKENGVDLIYYTDQRVPEEFPTFKDKNRLLEYIYRDKT